jgi:hypothetical protein
VNNIATCMSDYRWDFGLLIGFIEYLQIVTTSYYNSFVNSHILQFITLSI